MAAYEQSEVLAILKRLLSGGRLKSMPKRPEESAMILALAASKFARNQNYSEAEVNDTLKSWLGSFCTSQFSDHVTFRRTLVDAGVLIRNREGSAYEANGEQIDNIIACSAQEIDPGQVYAEILEQREIRKQQYNRGGV